MTTTHTNKFLLLALCFGCGGESIETHDQLAIEPICGPSTKATISPTSASTVIDDRLSTSFGASNNDWQRVTIDLGCARAVTGFRRNMVKNQSYASRSDQGETWRYSSDGSTWIVLTAADTFGWQSYTSYGTFSEGWRAVAYGWSKWLRPKAPVNARFVRYDWDGNYDALAEIEVDARTISSSRGAINGTSKWNVIDADVATGLETGYSGWQSVTIDLGRTVRLSRLRRNMSGPTADRGAHGERWSTSIDGTAYVQLSSADSLPYGWTAWFEIPSPPLARFVRFSWEGNGDRLNEIGHDDVSPGSDSSYDFDWTPGSFTPSVPDFSTIFPAPMTWSIMTDANVGMSGFYQGEIYSNVGNGPRSRVSASLMRGSNGEIRGTLHFVEGLTPIAFGGFGCSNKTIPAGTRFNVRMQPWTNDGRFNEAGTLPYHQYRYARGSTSRPVSGFAIGGTASLTFYAQLWNKGIGAGAPSSHLAVYIEYATPCSDGPALFLTLTRNNTVLRKMVGL
jgi:hypothetical protein